MGEADPIDAAELRRSLLGPGRPWRRVDVVPRTGSTNADLVARARAGEAPGAVLITDYQAAGRGRRGRDWTAPPGSSVAMSVLLRPTTDPGRWTWLPLLAGLAVADALIATTGVPAELKWPNDVLVGEGKICGVLAERVDTGRGTMAVVGTGINVALTESELPVPTATSLALQGLADLPSRTDLIVAVLTALAGHLERWQGGDPVRPAYERRCTTLGRRVRVLLTGDQVLEGVAEGIENDGRLRVVTASGPCAVGAGDVIHLR